MKINRFPKEKHDVYTEYSKHAAFPYGIKWFYIKINRFLKENNDFHTKYSKNAVLSQFSQFFSMFSCKNAVLSQ